MDYSIREDLEMVKELEDISWGELAANIGVTEQTIYRWLKGDSEISVKNMDAFYTYAFRHNINVNSIHEQLVRESHVNKDHLVLFHGAKNDITDKISLDHSKGNNDFGRGFYCGESLEQSAMFVANYPKSSVYMLSFDARGLQSIEFGVDQEWMLTIAYYRGRLKEYEEHPRIQDIVHNIESADYIIAPIADNRMFMLINSFIDGDITDVQCKHALSATNLGMQYVFVSDRAIDQLEIVHHAYLTENEKMQFVKNREEQIKNSSDKATIAKKKYRGEGLYIDQIFK